MVTQIDPISTPPTPADTPSDFEQKASQVWGDLFKAVPQMNAQAQEIEALGLAAVAAGQSAQADSDAALGYRNEARAARDAALGYQTGASGYNAAAGAARTGAELAASDAADAAGRAEAAAAEAESTLANAVQRTAATGAAMLPEGADAQRPPTGSIPAGALIIRGSTQAPADYKAEFWDRAAAAWKAFADRTWVGQQVTAAVNLVKDWVDQLIGFTILSPNGGAVAVNSRYVMANPFPGFHVLCIAEVQVSGVWGETGWIYAAGGYGVKASQSSAEGIVVRTGGVALLAGGTGADAGGTFNFAGAVTVPLPCRVKVWKLKGAV